MDGGTCLTHRLLVARLRASVLRQDRLTALITRFGELLREHALFPRILGLF